MKIFCSFLLLFTALAGSAQDPIDRSSLKLQGPVKSLTEVTYTAEDKFGEIVKTKKRVSATYDFNRAGQITKAVYEKDGDRITAVYKFHKNGKLAEIAENAGEYGKTVTLFNESGLLTELNEYDEKGKLERKRKNKYNGKNLIVESSLYNGDGSLHSKETFGYDKSDRLSIEKHFDDKDNQNVTKLLAYHNNGLPGLEDVITAYHDGAVSLSKTYFHYNAKNQLVEKENIFTIDEPEQKSQTFLKMEYDSKGNMIKETKDEKNYTTNSYTYDSHDNWTKEVNARHTSTSDLYLVTERSIRYY